jgi:hypothetical protein
MLATTQVIASVSCWPRRCDHERHHFGGLRVAGRTSSVGRVCTNFGQIACGTLGGLRKKKINGHPDFSDRRTSPSDPSAAS